LPVERRRLTPWDEQSLPYGAPQDARLREADVFVREVKAVASHARGGAPALRAPLPRAEGAIARRCSRTRAGSNWALWSAALAALTAIYAKIGLEGIDSDLATRT
jgi:hypothetical protein